MSIRIRHVGNVCWRKKAKSLGASVVGAVLGPAGSIWDSGHGTALEPSIDMDGIDDHEILYPSLDTTYTVPYTYNEQGVYYPDIKAELATGSVVYFNVLTDENIYVNVGITPEAPVVNAYAFSELGSTTINDHGVPTTRTDVSTATGEVWESLKWLRDEVIVSPGETVTFTAAPYPDPNPYIPTMTSTDKSDFLPKAATTYGDQSPVIKFEWDFDGDGTYDASARFGDTSHTYNELGSYDVKMRATTANGMSAETTTRVVVSDFHTEVYVESESEYEITEEIFVQTYEEELLKYSDIYCKVTTPESV